MAIAYRQRIDDDTEFALWKIEEQADELYKQLQLDEAEKAYVEKLSHSKRYLHWLGTRVLLRKMLSTDEYIDCKVDAHGKPYLVNLPYHISLSHSFDYAAVMISKTHKVGIDIEQIKEKVERIASKFMRPDELAFIGEDKKIEHLYVCWCAKEAVYKCNGQKEVSFADNIFLEPFSFEHHGVLNANLHKNELNLDYTVGYMQYADYMIGYVKEDK
ncbi:4'-phosphopantetheinyl transferase family protein [Mucilaginibacter ginsenosidivorax]|uniref:4'-phosphopantetheinyl transferase superfamily protein n=1 Tax=Mucilaginibacter ginsenosidivorax TaxID=862126 RepID=A0A5B8W4M4_9SPHI|nr:4'-phosphopantetheinyl transferase superfamily protein [Mucilaginibacter ginsenosidivorax]QEC77866.1 4'-phosphopantetheinyl transferase superfamily protein [Mucilaginibacter ginsenosidivorax]